MLPGDRLLAILIKPVPAGSQFTAWPLHLTIVPWFRLELNSTVLARKLKQRLQTLRPFDILIGEQTIMGHHKQVNLVKLPSPLLEIESQARALLKRYDSWLVDETTKRPRKFQPHITWQGEKHLMPGDHFLCSELDVISQQGTYKLIEAEMAL